MIIGDGADASHALVKELERLASRHGYQVTYSVGWELAARETTQARSASATQTALYIASLIGAEISGSTITNITGAKGLIVYYDPFLAANAYLDDKNYALTDGGELVANVPEPAGITLLLTGLTAMGWRRRSSGKKG